MYKLKILVLLLIINISSPLVYANATKLQVINEEANTLSELFEACPEIANATTSKFVNKNISGAIIKIKGKEYQVRYFGFEDTKGILPKDITFAQYILQNNLTKFESISMESLEGIYFKSFDYRRANLNDGVYFSMAIRKL